MKIAIYARVSTKDGSQDTENQLHELRRFSEASGWTITREYVDYESGKSGARDEFREMLSDASRRKFKAVLVWALDRFTREGIEATFGYVRKLKDGGVDFVSYSEPHFRTTGPAGELMLAVAAWIAEQERKRISERTKAGLATCRRNGIRLGRRPKHVDSGLVLRLKAQGMGVIPIAAELGRQGSAVSRETVRRIIKAAKEGKQ